MLSLPVEATHRVTGEIFGIKPDFVCIAGERCVEYGVVELIFAAKVGIDQRFVDTRHLGDAVDPRASQPPFAELNGRGIEEALFGAFDISHHGKTIASHPID